MPFLRPLVAILIGLSAAAGVGSRLTQETAPPSPPPPASVPASVPGCSAPQVQCRYGYVPDDRGCPSDFCAQRPVGAVEETPPAAAPSERQPSGQPGEQQQFQGPDDARCLADNLRNLARWEKDLFRGIDQQLRGYRSSKTPVPDDVQAAVNNLRQQFAQAKSAGSCQEMSELNNQLNEAVQPVLEQLHQLEQVANDARCVKDSLRGILELERRPIKEMDRKLRALEKQKIAPPADIVTALDSIREKIAQAKQATTCEDISGLNQEVFGQWNDMQEKFFILDFLAQAPRMLKQIDRELNTIDRQWARAVKQARGSATDLSDLVAKGEGIIAEMHALFEEFKSVVSSGDIERMMGMEDRGQDAEEKRSDLFEIINTVQALANIPREIKGLDRRVADLRRQARNAERQKADAGELRACLDGYGPVVASLKAVAAQKPIDQDALADAIQNAEEEMGKCQDLADDLSGRRGVLEELFSGGLQRGIPQPLGAPVR